MLIFGFLIVSRTFRLPDPSLNRIGFRCNRLSNARFSFSRLSEQKNCYGNTNTTTNNNEKGEIENAIVGDLSSYNSNKINRHIFLCCDQTKPLCVDKQVSLISWDFLKRRIKELKKEGIHANIARTKANCLQVCNNGPIAVVYPEGSYLFKL